MGSPGQCQAICSFPNGKPSACVMVLSFVAYLLALVAILCFNFTVDFDGDGSQLAGLWGVHNPLMVDSDEEESTCVPYPPGAVLGSAFEAARAFGGLGVVFNALTMVYGFAMACMSMSRKANNFMRVLSFLGSLSEVMTFVVFASDLCTDGSGCTFSYGSACAIASSIAAFIAGVCLSKIQLHSEEEFAATATPGTEEVAPPGKILVTETVGPDGTKTIVKTTVHPDGSKTIEELIEHSAQPGV